MLVNRNIIPPFILFALCLIVMLTALPDDQAFAFPWDTQNSIANALVSSAGQTITCERVVVDRMAARGNPAYFVVRDQFDTKSRIAVISRPPLALKTGQTVDVSGTVAVLPNGEKCITGAVVYGYFKNGQLIYSYILGESSIADRQVLPIPDLPVPPSDPSIPSTGEGTPVEVTSDCLPDPAKYPNVQSLLSSLPEVLTSVELGSLSVVETGDRYVVVGDLNNASNNIKIYTNASASIETSDRIIKLTATAHTENGQLVLYSDIGPEPYFDPQGFIGQISHAGPGTVAYAATLKDSNISSQPGFSVMTMDPPGTADGSWIYLTGQVITAVGKYYSYDIDPNGWVYIYYVQGIDRTPGIRVLDTTAGSGGSNYACGQIVDVMAKLNTKDGERVLGVANTTNPSDYNSVECKLLDDAILPIGFPLLPLPAGMNNRDLGGTRLGDYNPGVTDGQGLYNIGSYVTVWGKVLERGIYQFDANGYCTMPYARIDDGSGVLSGNCSPSYGGPYGNRGVIIFGDSAAYRGSIDYHVSVTGPTSVWKPKGSTDTYRAIWTPSSTERINVDPSASGIISGTITLYDMTTDSSQVTLCSNCGRTETLTVARGAGDVGTASYHWTGIVPSFYLISAKCEEYKTRTYTNPQSWVNTGTGQNPVWQITRNIYLTPLRKLTLRTQDNRNYIDACSSSSLNIIATVVDDGNTGIAGRTVRFATTAGSFNATTLQQNITATTNASGEATVTLYGMHWAGTASIRATDDATTPDYPNTSDDTYRCDWEELCDNDGYGQAMPITISAPTLTAFDLTESQSSINRCGSESSTITANVQLCGSAPPAGTLIRFTIPAGDPAVFVSEAGVTISADGKTATKETTTVGSYGRAVVHVTADSLHHFGTATITADLPDYQGTDTRRTTVTVVEYNTRLQISANPTEIVGTGTSTITFTATNPATGAYINGVALTIRTTSGSFDGGQTQITRTTSGYGTATATLYMSSGPSAYVSASYNDGCNGTVYIGTVVVYRQPPWNNISVGVNYSSILVDDLIPTSPDDGKREVAVISKDDGRMYIWDSEGTLKWTSKNANGDGLRIDINGDNTLSTADIDGKGGLEIIAPARGTHAVYAFGYDTGASPATFKPLAGWPVFTHQYDFHRAAAAIGDANLDGTREIVAADYCCYVYSWNPTGNTFLWEQITGSVLTSIINSSVALGDVNSFADIGRIPDAIVGSWYSDHELFAFPGDDWGSLPANDPNHLSAQWPPYNTDNNIECSPAIGLIDGDDENDVAVCDDNGKLYIWLSSTQSWVSYQLASSYYTNKAIKSSPAIVNLNNQRCVVVGCNNGRIYAVKHDGSPIGGWPATGILLNSSPRVSNKITASPVVGDVMGTGSPQIVAASTDGDVYVIWSDGYNNSTGPVAKVWTCAQPHEPGVNVEVNSTPAICSLDGSTISLVVGSNDGIYKFDLFSGTFVANSDRWPWPTFHRDNARTGCATVPAGPVCASVYGKVTLGGSPVPGARVSIKTTSGKEVAVYNRPDAVRIDPVISVGDFTPNNEINEGDYCINQIPVGTYQITATDKDGNHVRTLSNVSITAGNNLLDITLP